MTFRQKLLYQLNEMKNAGGIDNVPPAHKTAVERSQKVMSLEEWLRRDA